MGLDLNDTLQCDPASIVVGPSSSSVMHYAGQELAVWAQQLGLSAVNTFAPFVEDTFFGVGYSRQIDFLLAPMELLNSFDYCRKLLASHPLEAGAVIEQVREVSAKLAEHLQPWEIALNPGKQEVVPTLCGPRGDGALRELQQLGRDLPETWASNVRYLGSRFDARLSSSKELAMRVRVARHSFFSTGKFWTTAQVPWRLKRTIFLCRVYNSILAGLEPFLLARGQETWLTRVVAGLGRVALRGEACLKEELEDGATKYRAMSTTAVLRRLRVPPVHEELVVRRLRWAQSWAPDAPEHVQPCSARRGSRRSRSGMLDLRRRLCLGRCVLSLTWRRCRASMQARSWWRGVQEMRLRFCGLVSCRRTSARLTWRRFELGCGRRRCRRRRRRQ